MPAPQFTMPPDTRAVGTPSPAADMNALIDAFKAGVAVNVLNTAFAGGADPTGTLDSTAAIQAAINSFGVIAGGAGGSGGLVYLPAGVYLISSTLVLQNKVILMGAGVARYNQSGWVPAQGGPTTIYLKTASNCVMVANYVSSNGVEANAQGCGLMNLRLYGNGPGQSAGSWHGVYWNTNPQFSQATNDDDFDANHFCWNVEVSNVKGDGFSAIGRSDNHYNNCRAKACAGNGFSPSFDTRMTDCVAAASGLTGMILIGPSSQAVNCKSFTSGGITPASGHGFSVIGDNQGAVTMASCYAQDNKAHGYYFSSSSRITVQGCAADSNSVSSAGTYAGLCIDGTTSNLIADLVCMDRFQSSVNTQLFALKIATNSGTPLNCDIRLKHSASQGSVTASAIIGTIPSAFSGRIVINNEEGYQNVAFAATITPNPYLGSEVFVGLLTASVTFANPANGHYGSRLRLVTQQDATGGRTYTFGTAYKVSWTPSTAANLRNVIEFIFDGTNWIQSYVATGLPA